VWCERHEQRVFQVAQKTDRGAGTGVEDDFVIWRDALQRIDNSALKRSRNAICSATGLREYSTMSRNRTPQCDSAGRSSDASKKAARCGTAFFYGDEITSLTGICRPCNG
jgi:hypothetical protein